MQNQARLGFDGLENGLRFGRFRTPSAMDLDLAVFAEAENRAERVHEHLEKTIVP